MNKINLRWVVISLIVIVVFLQIFAIINGYIFLTSIANTYVNQSPLWLGFVIGALLPLALVVVYIRSMVLITKNKIQGYKYAGFVSLIMFIQLMGPFFEGKKEFLEISVALWPLTVLGILSFFAYSKLKTEQPSELDIKKKSNIGNFIVVILVILFAIFLTIQQQRYAIKTTKFPSVKIISPQDGLTFKSGDKINLQWQSDSLISNAEHPLMLDVLLTSENSEKVGCGIATYSSNSNPSNYLLTSTEIYLPPKVCVGKYSDGINSELGNPYTATVQVWDFNTKKTIAKDSITLFIKN